MLCENCDVLKTHRCATKVLTERRESHTDESKIKAVFFAFIKQRLQGFNSRSHALLYLHM